MFAPPGGGIVFTGPRHGPMSPLGSFWRDIISIPARIWLLPTTLFSLWGRQLRTPVALDVDAGRVFRVDATSTGLHVPPLDVQPPARTLAGGAGFGQTGATGPDVFVAYCTQSDDPPATTAPRSSQRDAAVFRQAKVSETLVHEVAVHAVALLAHRWPDGRRLRNHYDGFGDRFMRDRSAWALYQSPVRPGATGLDALLRDSEPRHLERGIDLERAAYHGGTGRYGLNYNDGVWGPAYRRHRGQAEFLHARRRERGWE